MKNTRLSSILSSGFIVCALAIGSLASTQSASAQTHYRQGNYSVRLPDR